MTEKKTVKAEKTAPVAKTKATVKTAGALKKTTAVKKTAPVLSVDQLEKEIRAQAQKVYENRQAKGLSGDELSDWLEAEIVIKKKYKL
jgi:ribosome-binding protein aMBF1 (putative translation factor)